MQKNYIVIEGLVGEDCVFTSPKMNHLEGPDGNEIFPEIFRMEGAAQMRKYAKIDAFLATVYSLTCTASGLDLTQVLVTAIDQKTDVLQFGIVIDFDTLMSEIHFKIINWNDGVHQIKYE